MKITCGQRVLDGARPWAADRRVNHPSTPAKSTLLAGVVAIFAELCFFFFDVNRK